MSDDDCPFGDDDEKIFVRDATMTKSPAGLNYEGKVEHIIEQVVLNVIVPDDKSARHFRAAVCEFSKALLRLSGLELPSDAIIDEIAGEMIEWHAPRPDEPGWNPDLADASAEQRLAAGNRHRSDVAAEESQQELARLTQEDKFQRVREDAARRRSRGDREGADFLEKWIADRERAR